VLLDKWREGFDIVLTIRAEDKRLPVGKRLASKLFYRVMRWLSDMDIRPARSDYRLMTRKAVNAFLLLRERHRFLRGLVQWLGMPTAEVEFEPNARRAGQTKYNWRRLLKLASDGILSFSLTPLRLVSCAGLLTLALSFAFAV